MTNVKCPICGKTLPTLAMQDLTLPYHLAQHKRDDATKMIEEFRRVLANRPGEFELLEKFQSVLDAIDTSYVFQGDFMAAYHRQNRVGGGT